MALGRGLGIWAVARAAGPQHLMRTRRRVPLTSLISERRRGTETWCFLLTGRIGKLLSHLFSDPFKRQCDPFHNVQLLPLGARHRVNIYSSTSSRPLNFSAVP